MTTRLALLTADNVSLLNALHDAIRGGFLDAELALLVSFQPEALVLRRAERLGVCAALFERAPNREPQRSREAIDAALAALLKPHRPDFVILADWPFVLGVDFLRHFPYRVLNVHHALPGRFPGHNAAARSLAAFQRGTVDHTGITIYLVPDERINTGPVLATEEVKLYAGDTLESLERRLAQVEPGLLVRTLARLIEGDEA